MYKGRYCHYRYGLPAFNPNLVTLTTPIVPLILFDWIDQDDNPIVDQDGNNIIFAEIL